MSSGFGGGFDVPCTPMMSQGDKDSVDESKMQDPSVVDTGVSGGNNPHGDASCGNVACTVTHVQRDDDDIQDWDAEVLIHILANILDKDRVEATDDFTMFVIANGVGDVRLLLTMSEDDFKLMGCDINFKTHHALHVTFTPIPDAPVTPTF